MCLACDSMDARLHRELADLHEEPAVPQEEIDGLVDRLNRMAGFPEGLKGKTTPGFFRLLSDYGGTSLVRVVNDAGGVRAVMGGYHPAKDFYSVLRGFVMGMDESSQGLDHYQAVADGYKERGYSAW
jgi:hypothetical protein